IQDIEELLRERCTGGDYLWCGMSAQFSANLRLGFASLVAIQRVFPEAIRIAGGTAITSMFKNSRTLSDLRPLSRICDYLIVGEGEEAISNFSAFCAAPSTIPPQVIDLHHDQASDIRTSYRPLDIRSLAQGPDYDWVRWDLYLSPSRNINYSPTR